MCECANESIPIHVKGSEIHGNVCLIQTGMHPYILQQLLQVEILGHRSCAGCLGGVLLTMT